MSTIKPLKPQLVQLINAKIKVIVPQEFYNKVKYLCSEIHAVEWSGILFYKVKGTIDNAEKLVITCMDILPMHKGTTAYTEYSFDERVVDHMIDNPHLDVDGVHIGHIHSHNNMGVFFSGTDNDELSENSMKHNVYVSLIVNNRMEMTARIAFAAVATSYAYKEFGGEEREIIVPTITDTTYAFWYDTIIDKPVERIKIPDNFRKNVERIIEEAEAKKTPPAVVKQLPAAKAPLNNGGAWGSEDWKKKGQDAVNNMKKNRDIQKDSTVKIEGLSNPTDEHDVEKFVCFILRGEHDEKTTLLDELEIVAASKPIITEMCSTIIKELPRFYTRWFNDLVNAELEDYLQTVEECIEILSPHEGKYYFVKPLVNTLQEYVTIKRNEWKRDFFDSENFDAYTDVSGSEDVKSLVDSFNS